MIIATYPGETLKDELDARGLSANQLALALRVPSGRINEIVNGKRAITPDTALRLARFFGNDAEFWINLQAQYDLYMAKKQFGQRIAAEVQPADNAA